MTGNRISSKTWLPLGAAMIFAVAALGSYSCIATAADIRIMLSGDQEVPPVKSTGQGSGTITISADGAVAGSVTTTDISGTAAHIHEGAKDKNGPVIIPFAKDGNTYTAPEGAKLSELQLASLRAGNLYINVHTAANPGGEIRGQLNP